MSDLASSPPFSSAIVTSVRRLIGDPVGAEADPSHRLLAEGGEPLLEQLGTIVRRGLGPRRDS